MNQPVNTIDSTSMQNIRNALTLLFAPGDVFEVRALEVQGRTNRTDVGWFNDMEKAAVAIADLSGNALGIYITMNPCLPEMLGRSCNRLTPWVPKDFATGDRHILRRRWILLDFDPVRSVSGISTTDAEKALAYAAMSDVYMWLLCHGVPADSIVRADSGNGYHLLIRVELQNDDASKALVDQVLAAVEAQIQNHPGVQMDRTNKNAARITKAYGSQTGKGDEAAAAIGRPHRDSGILASPESIVMCPSEVVEKLAGFAPAAETTAPAASATTSVAWIDGWLERYAERLAPYGMKEAVTYDKGRKWNFETCPFNPVDDPHGENESFTLIEAADGKLKATCQHNRCRKGNGWKAFRELIEPTAERTQSASTMSESDETPLIEIDSSLVPVSKIVIPPFPDLAKAGLAHEYAEMWRGKSDAPYPFWYFSYLAMAGALLSPWVHIGPPPGMPIRLFVFFLGPTSQSRKSITRRTTLDFFMGLGDAIPENRQLYRCKSVGSDAGLFRVAAAAGDRPVVYNPDEGSELFTKMSIPQSTLGETLHDLFDDDEIEANTKEGKTSGQRTLRLTVMTATTPERFATIFDNNVAATGCANRFFLVTGVRDAHAGIASMQPPDPARLDDLRRATRDAVQGAITGQRQMMYFTPDADEVFDAWFKQFEESVSGLDRYQRVDVYVRRLAAIIQYMRRGVARAAPLTEIGVEATRIACALGDYQIAVRQGNKIIVGDTVYSRHEQVIREYLRPRLTRPGEAITRRDIQRDLHAYRWGVGSFGQTLQALDRNDEIEIREITKTSGRRTTVVVLGEQGLLPEER